MSDEPDSLTESVHTTVPVFRDRAYKRRTLILPDGRSVSVTQSRISASDPELLRYLEQHPDFSRVD